MKGIVAAGHPAVAGAAADMLAAGGNAFDAAVAAGFTGAVAEPGFTSLGGGGFLLAHTATGEDVLFDFFVDTPGRGVPARDRAPHFLPITVRFRAADQVFLVGLGSAGVPGTLAGYLHVHRRLGRLPLADAVAPAVTVAEEGAVVNHIQAQVLALLEPVMVLTDRGRAIYAPDGRILGEGDRLRNPELAEFLRSLAHADSPETLYGGTIAKTIARDMAEGDGLVTEADLAAYHVIEREPLSFTYRGHRVLTNPTPSFGGTLVAAALAVLEERYPEPPPTATDQLLALTDVAVEIDRRRLAGRTARGASRGTTHVSVADGDGNVASMTTSNGEGSGYVVPGTGVMLNNMLGEDDLHPDGFHSSPPGERVPSMMAPSLIMGPDGSVKVALGSGGSKRIRTAIVQVISSVLDRGLGLAEAIDAARAHWDGSKVQVEPGLERATLDALRDRWAVNEWPTVDLYFGGVHAVAPGRAGAGDRRRGGVVLEMT